MIDFSKFELSKSDADAFQSLVGPEGLWKKKQLDQLKLIQEVGLSHTDSVLELGCGPIRFGCGLIDYLNTGCYQGIDIREESISQANLLVKKFDLNNKSPFLSTSDDFGLDVIQKDSIDFIWAFNVLSHY
jgi:SAM-dependent methyltransferase